MVRALEILVVLSYAAGMLVLTVYSVAQLHVMYHYLRRRRAQSASTGGEDAPGEDPDPPPVTVQIPVYNEGPVVLPLLEAVARFEYPRDRLEVQVVDDSTDATRGLVARKVAELRSRGLRIHHLHRTRRTGFKAGALQAALAEAHGDFVVLFDADFRPEPDFLRRALAPFRDPRVGVVQTRWEHLNPSHSLVTRLQAFGLDLHFLIEQDGRDAAGLYLRFNGTAGVWRKECLLAAGGWQGDTLTEDLDLSYRAQMAGWRVRYLAGVTAPAQLPVTMGGFRIQQFRWNQGQAETVRKLLPALLRMRLPFVEKAQAVIHLLNSTLYVVLFGTTVLSVPLVAIVHDDPLFRGFFAYVSFALVNTVAFGLLYYLALRRRSRSAAGTLREMATFLPVFLAAVIGISLHNSIATLRGYLGWRTPFHRTPKVELDVPRERWRIDPSLLRGPTPLTVLELAMAAYFLLGAGVDVSLGELGLLPFHLLGALGFLLVAGYSFAEVRLGTSRGRVPGSGLAEVSG